ncbi:hypothetical protein QVD17_42015 [Tagetes erecta]|uniref:Uncharacterized protein n=1 Tax=Tagetes erecta TaxID=13708 RepID=A0AAD8NE13_TARER|nr:hypothetical protein QVD17_42015 [Tagetes erecta]
MTSMNTTVKLHDTGNLVMMDQHENIIWQSFDYPTEHWLPGMKLGNDYLRGVELRLSSWKSDQRPLIGEYTWGAEKYKYPDDKLRQGSLIKYRGEPWRNKQLKGISFFSKNLTFTYDVVSNENEVSCVYNHEKSSTLFRLTLSSSGKLESWGWVEGAKNWQLGISFPKDPCDTYNICSAYGSCAINSIQQSCACLDETNFVPRNKTSWEMGIWSDGCVRRTPLNCKIGSETFINYVNVKLPDTHNSWYNLSMNMQECEAKCLENCTCTAYANPDTSLGGGMGCLLWFGELIDIQVYPQGTAGGREIFVRMASSESVAQSNSMRKGGANIKIILPVTVTGVLLIGFITSCLWHARKNNDDVEGLIKNVSTSHEEGMELPLFTFSTISNMTAYFSPENKLGEGGFGPVYKGVLEDGQHVAVKRLSRNSSQGVDEFKNEVICISKLQHRNLVKLLGCCIHGNEKLLIYEYMSNKSLDAFIFVVGTYGYMSPEYAIDGIFSIKSDVFSFGVLVLEIISGKRNRRFTQQEHNYNLMAHTWDLYNDGRSMDLIDASLADSCNPPEVLRSIEVGLLCVQQNAGDRPYMSSVISILDGKCGHSPPKQPAYFMESDKFVADFSTSTNPTGSIDELTITEVDVR